MNGVDALVLAAYASLLVELTVFPIPSEASTWQITTARPAARGTDELELARGRSFAQKLLRYFVPTATCVRISLNAVCDNGGTAVIRYYRQRGQVCE